jgi:TonB family protein
MPQTARAVLPSLALIVFPAAALAQAGPAEPQVIAAAPTAKVNLNGRKIAGYVTATVHVGTDGKVKDVQVTENTTEGMDQALVKVLQSARFRPAIDAAGQPIEGNVDMKVELRPSTGAEPKPVAAKPDPQLTDKEKVRIKKMRCSDFVWEWNIIRDQADDAAGTEFMPRIAISMYAAMRSEAGDYVDAKVWKAAPKVLRQTADQCKDNPTAPFWDGVFKSVMDEAVFK